MRSTSNNQGTIFPNTLIAGAIFGLLTLTSMIFMPEKPTTDSKMFIEPNSLTIQKGEKFTIDVFVSSEQPVNTFSGVLEFNQNNLTVDKISYNTSIANLWTQEPWYNKGTGTISFTGGSTIAGGFAGTGSLLTVTFIGMEGSTTTLALREVRILKHDGLGTDADVSDPLDALFIIKSDLNKVATADSTKVPGLSTDLNNDNHINMYDMSIFMTHLATGNLRSDFNNDNKVGTADLSILLQNRD